jgi:hypothetical protein
VRTLHVDGGWVRVAGRGRAVPAQHQAAHGRGGHCAERQDERGGGQQPWDVHRAGAARGVLLRAQAAAAEALPAQEEHGGVDQVELHGGQLRGGGALCQRMPAVRLEGELRAASKPAKACGLCRPACLPNHTAIGPGRAAAHPIGGHGEQARGGKVERESDQARGHLRDCSACPDQTPPLQLTPVQSANRKSHKGTHGQGEQSR